MVAGYNFDNRREMLSINTGVAKALFLVCACGLFIPHDYSPVISKFWWFPIFFLAIVGCFPFSLSILAPVSILLFWFFILRGGDTLTIYFNVAKLICVLLCIEQLRLLQIEKPSWYLKWSQILVWLIVSLGWLAWFELRSGEVISFYGWEPFREITGSGRISLFQGEPSFPSMLFASIACLVASNLFNLFKARGISTKNKLSDLNSVEVVKALVLLLSCLFFLYVNFNVASYLLISLLLGCGLLKRLLPERIFEAMSFRIFLTTLLFVFFVLLVAFSTNLLPIGTEPMRLTQRLTAFASLNLISDIGFMFGVPNLVGWKNSIGIGIYNDSGIFLVHLVSNVGILTAFLLFAFLSCLVSTTTWLLLLSIVVLSLLHPLMIHLYSFGVIIMALGVSNEHSKSER